MRTFFVKNFKSKKLFDRKLEIDVLKELGNMYFLDDLTQTFFKNENLQPLREREASETPIAK